MAGTSQPVTDLVQIAPAPLARIEPKVGTLVRRVKAKQIKIDNLQQRSNGVWYCRKGKDVKSTGFTDYDSAKGWRDKYVAKQEDRKRVALGITPKEALVVPTVAQWFTRYREKVLDQSRSRVPIKRWTRLWRCSVTC